MQLHAWAALIWAVTSVIQPCIRKRNCMSKMAAVASSFGSDCLGLAIGRGFCSPGHG